MGYTEVKCPICGKRGVKAFYKPSYLEHSTSRISAGSKTKYYRVPESYEVLSGCPHCGKSTEIFGSSGTAREADRLGVPLLGSIPIDPRIAVGGDAGTPIVSEIPDSPAALAFEQVAKVIRDGLK